MTFTARPMTLADLSELTRMRGLLYTSTTPEESDSDLRYLLKHRHDPAGQVGNQECFVVERAGGPGLCGFAEVMMRSHAEGCWEETALGKLGIAHLEGWWVDEDIRKQGVGRALVSASAAWAREQGSPVLASDAELENLVSHASHRSVGFAEVERSVHFVKRLDP